MNRKHQTIQTPIPAFLANASSLSERAARAMCPNGRDLTVAIPVSGNVITLQNSNRSATETAAVPLTDSGNTAFLDKGKAGSDQMAGGESADER